MDGVQGYDEDQIALVVLDESKFVEWIPVILGNPTINHIINVGGMPGWHIYCQYAEQQPQW